MRTVKIFPFALLLAQVASQSLLELATEIPACALKCISPAISGVTCSATTVPEFAACLCPNNAAKKRISACVIDQLQTCHNYTGLLGVLEIQADLCQGYPDTSRTGDVIISAIVLLAVTIPIIFLRFFSRLAFTKQLWWDDYFLGFAGVVLIANLAMNISIAQLGFGKHLWNVKGPNIIPILKMFYFIQIAYIGIQVLTKISLLLFLLRIFPQRWFRYATWTTMGFVALHGLIFMFIVAFQSTPIHLFWDRYVDGQCYNIQAVTYAGAGCSIFEDFFILALPIPYLRSLNMKIGQKVGLIVMFSFGTLACITSIVRLCYLTNYGGLSDATWDDVPTSVWSVIENCVAVICACLPTLRPLLSRLLPKGFGSTSGRALQLGSTQRSGKGNGMKMEVIVETEIDLRSRDVRDMDGPTLSDNRIETDELWSPSARIPSRKVSVTS